MTCRFAHVLMFMGTSHPCCRRGVPAAALAARGRLHSSMHRCWSPERVLHGRPMKPWKQEGMRCKVAKKNLMAADLKLSLEIGTTSLQCFDLFQSLSILHFTCEESAYFFRNNSCSIWLSEQSNLY